MAEIDLEHAPQQARDLFNKGFTAFERGNLDYAIDCFKRALDVCPGLLQARKFLRAAGLQRYRKQKAGAMSGKLHELKAMPIYMKVMGAMAIKKYHEALDAAENLLLAYPVGLRFIRAAADAAMAGGMTEVAIMTLESAREQNADDVEILKTLGDIYVDLGAMHQARECFEKVCEITPNDPNSLRKLKNAIALDTMNRDGWEAVAKSGGSYRDMIRDQKEAALLEQQSKAVKTEKDADSLIESARQKIQEQPGNVNYYRQLARLYVQKKMFAEAVEVLTKAMELNPGDPELDEFVTNTRIQQFEHEVAELRAAGNGPEAEIREQEKRQFVFDNLQDRVKRYPNDLRLRFDLGVILYDNDYIDQAIQQFQTAQRSPKHRVTALYYLGMCFKAKEQFDMAIEQLDRANAEHAPMDETKKSLLYELGELHERQGRPEKAGEFFKQLYSVDIGYRDVARKVEDGYKR